MPWTERMRRAAGHAVAHLTPAYFALVMATAIVAIACEDLHRGAVARALFAVSLLGYALLWALTIARVAGHRARVLADLRDHERAAGFFTVVAATSLLGDELARFLGALRAALGLWTLGALLWLVLTYEFFTVMTAEEAKPSLENGIDGRWLMCVVATQSVANLAVSLAPSAGSPGLLFTGLALYLLGCMLYLLVTPLILYRLMFFPLTAQAFTPLYWINMGAIAITTLAGSELLRATSGSDVLAGLAPFLEGFTAFSWAAATWWIPLLVALDVWRHGIRRVPLRYDPQYWGLVFPLGMYTAATFALAGAAHWPFLLAIPRVFVWLALAAWLATLAGLVRHLAAVVEAPA